MRDAKQRVFVNTLFIYIIIQPILELMWLNNGELNNIFGVTIPTFVRIIGIGVIGIEWLWINRNSKKIFWLGGYCLVVGIYFVFHHFNCTRFNPAIGDDLYYSLVQEAFYLIRMMIPLCLIVFVQSVANIQEFIRKVLLSITLLTSSLVIIPNLFGVSFGAYTNERLSLTIVDWFLKPEQCTYLYTASKGFFHRSIISTVLVMILPYVISLFFKTGKLFFLLVVCYQGIAMLSFGTKAASLSVIICMLLMLLCYVFYCVLRKKYSTMLIRFILGFMVLVLFIGVYSKSPCQQRLTFEEQFYEIRDNEVIDNENVDTEEVMTDNDIISNEVASNNASDNIHIPNKVIDVRLENIDNSNPNEIIEYFEAHKGELSITLDFLEGKYGYKVDPVFWKEFVENTVPSERMQNRFVEEEILKRIVKQNKNLWDKWWGIGYTRTSSVYNLEKDFIYQYYSMGIVGVILLLGPYLIILLYGIIKIICNMKNSTLEQCSFVLGLGLTFFVAYFSGNMMESLGITIIIGCIEGYFLKEMLLVGDKR